MNVHVHKRSIGKHAHQGRGTANLLSAACIYNLYRQRRYLDSATQYFGVLYYVVEGWAQPQHG
jgi:hypothetical protein